MFICVTTYIKHPTKQSTILMRQYHLRVEISSLGPIAPCRIPPFWLNEGGKEGEIEGGDEGKVCLVGRCSVREEAYCHLWQDKIQVGGGGMIPRTGCGLQLCGKLASQSLTNTAAPTDSFCPCKVLDQEGR